jgi:flagellar export protein FliJ
MSNYRSLADFAGDRADQQQVQWRMLMGQCDAAKRKLGQLGHYAERYRAQMGAHLADGLDATAAMGFLRFIEQVETVVAKQQREVARLDLACREQWHRLVEARRERRMYEVLRDRAVAEQVQLALRRSQIELDELMGRIVKAPQGG